MTDTGTIVDASRAEGGDWASKLAERIESVVEVLRDKSVRPVMSIVQGVIYGLVAFFMVIVIVVIFSAALVRLLDDLVFHRQVWASYAVLGGIFTVGGSYLLHRRQPTA